MPKNGHAPEFSRVRIAIVNVDEPAAERLDDPCLLTAAEIGRARAFRGELLARRYRRSHAALRLLLSRETGCEPAALRITAAPGGKPFLEDSDLCFSLSHSGHLAAIAAARGCEIGIDVEGCRPSPDDVLPIAAASLHPEEYRQVSQLPVEARGDAFLRLWTVREAFLKALGTGLAADIATINASPFLVGATVLEWKGWTVRTLPAPPGAFAAVAGFGAGWEIEYVSL